jgi:nucleoside phosphorylase
MNTDSASHTSNKLIVVIELGDLLAEEFRWDSLKAWLVSEFGGDFSDPEMIEGALTIIWSGADRDTTLNSAEEGVIDKAVAAAGGLAVLEILEDEECIYQFVPKIPSVERALIKDVGSTELQTFVPFIDILILTVTDTEREAILDAMQPLPGQAAILEGAISKTTYRFGLFGRYNVAHVESTMGGDGRQGATLTAREAIDELHPKAVLLLGISFGVNRKKQRLGDVIVADWIFPYDLQRVGATVTRRGVPIICGSILSERFRTRRNDWKLYCGRRPVKVQQGLMLSGSKLIDNKLFRDNLVSVFPEALGGEMEGAGAYAAAQQTGVEMILVKAICDWADGHKNDRAQPFASYTAVSLAKHVLSKDGVLSSLGARDNLQTQPSQQIKPEEKGEEQTSSPSVNLHGGFYQPGWTVKGDVVQAAGDLVLGEDGKKETETDSNSDSK